ncbi:putative glucan endo-1,3-beta-D-glucosidase [Dioscorea sansibarensis]
MRFDHRPVIAVLLVLSLRPPCLDFVSAVGVNWGTSSSHPLPPSKVVQSLLRTNNIVRVKLSDANSGILESLSGTGIGVVVGIPNEMLKSLSSSKKAAQSWVHDNITRYIPATGGGVRIEYIAVGDEPFLLSNSQQFQSFVVGAATNIHLALTAAKLSSKVKIIVPCSSDVYQSDSNLPSEGHFRPDLNNTMTDLLSFLDKNGSPFLVDINPFLSLQKNKNLSMDFVLFQPKAHAVKDGHLKYKNSFDASMDTLITSLSKAGFGDMDIIVGRIGWPTDGALNATPSVAQTFMKGLIDHLQSNAGTPLRPKRPPAETYLFSLLDEDQRSITSGNFERHWGIFTFDGQAKYNVDLGQGSKNLVNARNVDYLASKWCVVNNNEELSNVSASFSNACSHADCSALSPGGSCFGITWPGNVSYAFNNYYQQHDQSGDSCDFGGLGLITTVDPSVGECRFQVAIRTSFSSLQRVLVIWWSVALNACVSIYLLGFGWC